MEPLTLQKMDMVTSWTALTRALESQFGSSLLHDLTIFYNQDFKVMVGNGNYMQAEGLIQQLTVQTQGNSFTLPVFLLPISGADPILGASWLKGQLALTWRIMTYYMKENSPHCTVNVIMILKFFPSLGLPDDMEPELVIRLHTYSTVFSNPSGLPPRRSHVHSIPLLEGSNPVKKEEIEKWVEDMLPDGLIQPSTSPFSSPIILVRKKDGSWRDHMHHLEIVLKILKQNQLFAKFSKCIFRVQQIGYLGHTLSGAGVTMDNEKLEAVINLVKPITVKQLRAFLGLTGFYRRFVKGYAQIAAPLTDFYRFQWTAFADKAFQELKSFLSNGFKLRSNNNGSRSPWGKENVLADALSKSLHMTWLELVNNWLQAIALATKKDEKLMKIYNDCLNNAGKSGEYSLQQEVLIWKGRIMLPREDTIIKLIISEFQHSKIGGHAGIHQTIARISSQFYWHKMQEHIRRFVEECAICQQDKVTQSLPAGLLQLFPIPNLIWEDNAMDFIISRPLSRGYSNIMVVVN
ncbi:hypothetical protein V8G54_029919 [Vigna mungo]|uniref:Integrase zinc-binding domain-containing protein n=1 Tax=Vigna mungo TaxID=3915 RepID=A0AAQ3RMB1_VIGMU